MEGWDIALCASLPSCTGLCGGVLLTYADAAVLVFSVFTPFSLVAPVTNSGFCKSASPRDCNLVCVTACLSFLFFNLEKGAVAIVRLHQQQLKINKL